jgi:uridylate kinase
MTTQYKRIVLKISGEILGSRSEGEPIHAQSLETICKEIKAVSDMGVEVGLVVGGGNIFRGLQGCDKGIDRTTGDSMGMLATVINGLALMDRLEKMGAVVRVQSAIPMDRLAEPYIQRRAVRHLERGRIVIFVAGTGNPYFSTDTAAALRASEISAEIILKATKVDGIYDKDPHKHEDASKYDKLTYMECLEKRLSVMDSTAFSLCMDNGMPILVFDLQQKHSIRTAVSKQSIGTIVA